MHHRTRLLFTLALGLLVTLTSCQHAGQSSTVGPADPAAASGQHPRMHTAPADVRIVEETWPDGTPRSRQQVYTSADGTAINHGLLVRWYDNGQREYEAMFVDGHKEGTATRWHRNGQKWTEERYKKGKKNGTCVTWDESGDKVKEEAWTFDKPHGTWTVWKRGKIKWQGRFEHGVPQRVEPPPRE